MKKEHIGYEGGLDNPMSWDLVLEKFHWLSETFADEDLRNRLIETVQQLDTRPISDLTDLLAQVRPTVVFPKTHPGIRPGSYDAGQDPGRRSSLVLLTENGQQHVEAAGFVQRDDQLPLPGIQQES